MLFALTRSNLFRQFPDEKGTILGLTEIVSMRRLISQIVDTAGCETDKSEHIYGNWYKTIYFVEPGQDVLRNNDIIIKILV